MKIYLHVTHIIPFSDEGNPSVHIKAFSSEEKLKQFHESKQGRISRAAFSDVIYNYGEVEIDNMENIFDNISSVFEFDI